MLRQQARSLDDARQQHNAVAAEVAAVQQEMTQLQITQWQPILAAFDQQLEVCPLMLSCPMNWCFQCVLLLLCLSPVLLLPAAAALRKHAFSSSVYQ